MSSVTSTRCALLLCFLASLFVLPETALADGKRPRRRKAERSIERPSSEFKVEPYGLEFHESLVGECVELLENGKVKKAVSRLVTAIKEWPKGASLNPLNELRLGLGMILLRSGQTKEALHSYLTPLGRMTNGSSAAPRAKIMWAICQRMGKPAAGQIPLQKPGQWEDALLAAAKQRAEELTREHDKRIKLIDRANWRNLSRQAKAASQLWDQVYCVRTADMEREGPPIARSHMETLAHEVNLVNDHIDAQVRELEMMQGVNAGGRRGRRGQVQVGAQPFNKGKYNKICKDIREAWKYGNSVVTEFKAVENQQPYGTALEADVRMRVPEFELPRPVK